MIWRKNYHYLEFRPIQFSMKGSYGCITAVYMCIYNEKLLFCWISNSRKKEVNRKIFNDKSKVNWLKTKEILSTKFLHILYL